MSFFLSRRWLCLAVVAVLSSGVYFGSAFSPALFDDMEAFNAKISQEMRLSGDWITPRANGVRYFEKPPLLYWLTALSFQAFGVSEFSARFPTRALAVGTILLTFLIGELIFGMGAGFYAGLILATSAGFYIFSIQVLTDPALTFFLAGAFFFFLRGYTRASTSSYLLCYLFIALAVLSKGLIGLAFPVLIIGFFLLVRREVGRVKEMLLAQGSLIFLGVSAPWHILVGLKNSGFFWFYFVNEHLYRFLGLRYPLDYGRVPLISFWLLHLAWLFPWSFFLPLGAKGLNSSGLPTHGGNNKKYRPGLALFIVVWALAIPLFFSFSSREENYTLPAFPALALLLGALLHQGSKALNAGLKRALAYPYAALFSLGAGAFIVVNLMLIRGGQFPLGVVGKFLDLSWLQAREGSYYLYFFGPLAEFKAEFQTALAGPLLATGWALLIGTFIAFILARKGKIPLATVSLILAIGVVFFSIHRSMVILAPQLSSKSLALAINRTWQPGEKIVINGSYELFSSVGFYVKPPVLLLNGRQEDLEFGSRYPDAQHLFIEETDFLSLWESGRRVYLLTFTGNTEEGSVWTNPALVSLKPNSAHLLAKSGTRLLLSNQP